MKLIISAIFLIFSLQVFAQPLTEEFKSLVTQNKIGSINEQAYCYSENGSVHGHQTAKLQRVASLTKLMTTLLASETMDLHARFTTKVFIGKDSLHIEGGKDPYFEEEKLFLLFRQLNELGYTTFKKVTFNADFHFYDVAMGEYESVTPEKTRSRLAYYMNPKNVQFLKGKWAAIRKFATEEGIDLSLKLPAVKAQVAAVSSVNRLAEKSRPYYHHSLPLHRLLKSMNVQSKNYVAENVFLAGSAVKSLTALLIEKNIDPDTFAIYNGSGLPMISGRNRLDNLASCETLLKSIELLSASLEKHHLVMSDVVAVVGGSDLGSFRERFLINQEVHEAVLAKTGTLKHTSSLGGVMLTDKVMPFAILNHTTSAAIARKFQDAFVSRMFDYLGTPTPVPYVKISIFPWDQESFFEASL